MDSWRAFPNMVYCMDKALITQLHGACGAIIFISAILLFILQKGTRTHKTIGKIYFYAWPIILITGYLIGSMVIVAIVFMGFYLAITGMRFAQRKNKTYERIDKIILANGRLVHAVCKHQIVDDW